METRRSCPVPAFLRSCVAAEIRRGTLERVPRTPQNFPERIIIDGNPALVPGSTDKPPHRTPPPTHLQCRAGTAAGVPGAKPPAKLTYSLPLPAGKGVGGIGAEKQAEGRQTGNHPVKPPPGIPPPLAASAPPGASPLSNTTFPPTSSAAQVQPQGCRGRSPRQN